MAKYLDQAGLLVSLTGLVQGAFSQRLEQVSDTEIMWAQVPGTWGYSFEYLRVRQIIVDFEVFISTGIGWGAVDSSINSSVVSFSASGDSGISFSEGFPIL